MESYTNRAFSTAVYFSIRVLKTNTHLYTYFNRLSTYLHLNSILPEYKVLYFS